MKPNARTAGVLHLIIILSGLFSELFVRSGIIVPGDANATAENIAANSFMFRIGFISDLIMVMSDVGVALLFYLLLKPFCISVAIRSAFLIFAEFLVMISCHSK